MALIKKTLFAENLDRYNTFITDTSPTSRYFNITELPDTFTGGKNAFLIAGSPELVADTLIKIEIKDASGNIIYHEPGEGRLITTINGEQFTNEYFEGVSKVVAVYIYPDTTAYGSCTITILGELSSYIDDNGLSSPIPFDWQGTYNVKWQRKVNVNPTLANTTKIRFYRRPSANISELISPIYRIDANTGLKINSGINQSFANIKISNLETFAGDVKRIKVFRTSLGDISDYDMIQDILVESKELLTTYGLSGSVVGNTGIFTSETLKQYWNTGSLQTTLTADKVESGLKLNGSGNLRYSSSLQLKSTNTYEINLDAFYSSSIDSNIGIYLSGSDGGDVLIGSLNGISPTKNLLDTTIPFKLDSDFASASLYFSQSNGEWHLGNISLKLSEDTAFSPDEVSFITTMPTVVGDEDFNFKFEFYDVNNNYVPVMVTGSANFTGGSNTITKLLTFESDRTAFRFSSGSVGNPPTQFVRFKTQRTNFTGSITYSSASFDLNGNYIQPSSYVGAYPGALSNVSDAGALLSISSFSGSVRSVIVGSIVYTASCEGVEEYETIYRFEDGDNAPGVFVTSNTNQFIYKATDLSLNPTGQIITIEAKRKNLASATTPLTVNSGSGKPPLTFVSTNATNGVDTYTIAGTAYPYGTGESTYFISGSDQFGNEFSDAIKITPVKILDGLSATLTNDNASLPALSNGFVASGSFLFTSGSVNVKVGNETITFDDDNDSNRANNTFAITNVSGIGCTPNGGNNSNPTSNSYSITNLSADSGSLDITINYKDGAGDTTSLIKTVTYTKNKKAAPVLAITSTPKDQSVTAKSTGAQIDSFANATISVKETYNGATSNLTINSLTATSSDIASISTTPSTGLITLNNKTLGDAVNSTTIAISAVVTDSEGVSRTITDTLSLSKVKKAAPVTLALLSSETQTILSSSAGFAAPSTFTTTVTEGSTNYSYSNAGTVNTYYISSISGGTNSNATITPTTPTTTTGTTVSITITYVNSEGTSGTITKSHKVAVALEGAKGVNGDNGAPGADGRRTATGMIFYQVTAATAPSTPTAASYTFSTNSFGSLTSNWAVGAPTYTAGNSNKYWYSTYTAVETTAGGGTAVPTFSAPAQAINFTGLVTFTSANNISDGTNSSNIVTPGAVANHIGGANVTTIEGGKISTGVITSTGYSLPSGETLASGTFTSAGTIFNLDNGSLRSKNFYIASNGDAVFKGTMQIGGTNLTASNTLNENTTKSQVGLGNVSNLTPQNQAQTGIEAGTTITGGGITLSNGGNIKGGQTDYNTGTGFFLGYHGTAPNGAYKFSIGNASTKGITWDGSTLSIGGDVNIGTTLASTVVSNASSALTNAATAQTTANSAATAAATAQNTADAKVSPSQVLNHIGGTNTTTISGGKVTTGQIKSGNHGGTADGSNFSTAGMSIDLDGGGISAKNFRITSGGDAFFKGDITGASGTFSGTLSGATISGGSITIGNNFSVSNTGILTASGANITGALTATDGTFGGWKIVGNQLKSNSEAIILDGGSNTITMTVSGLNRFKLSTDSTLPEPNVTGGGSLTIGAVNTIVQGNGTLEYTSNNFTAPNSVITNFEILFVNSGYIVEYGGGSTATVTITYRIRNLSTGNVVASVTLGQAAATGGDNAYTAGSVSGGGPYQTLANIPNGTPKLEVQTAAGQVYRAELYIQYDTPQEGTPENSDSSYLKLVWSNITVNVAVQVATVVINGGGFLSAVNAGKYLRMSNSTTDAVNIEGGLSWDKVGGRPGYVARAWVVATWDNRTNNYASGTIRAGQNVLAVGRNNTGWHNISFINSLTKGNVSFTYDSDTLAAVFGSGLRRYSGTGANTGEYQVDVACNPNFGYGSSVMVYTYDNDRNLTENVNLLNVVVFSA